MPPFFVIPDLISDMKTNGRTSVPLVILAEKSADSFARIVVDLASPEELFLCEEAGDGYHQECVDKAAYNSPEW